MDCKIICKNILFLYFMGEKDFFEIFHSTLVKKGFIKNSNNEYSFPNSSMTFIINHYYQNNKMYLEIKSHKYFSKYQLKDINDDNFAKELTKEILLELLC